VISLSHPLRVEMGDHRIGTHVPSLQAVQEMLSSRYVVKDPLYLTNVPDYSRKNFLLDKRAK
jgi:hypothetical protein